MSLLHVTQKIPVSRVSQVGFFFCLRCKEKLQEEIKLKQKQTMFISPILTGYIFFQQRHTDIMLWIRGCVHHFHFNCSKLATASLWSEVWPDPTFETEVLLIVNISLTWTKRLPGAHTNPLPDIVPRQDCWKKKIIWFKFGHLSYYHLLFFPKQHKINICKNHMGFTWVPL